MKRSTQAYGEEDSTGWCSITGSQAAIPIKEAQSRSHRGQRVWLQQWENKLQVNAPIL